MFSAVVDGKWGGSAKLVIRNSTDDMPLASCELDLVQSLSRPFTECFLENMELVNSEGKVVGEISLSLLFAKPRIGTNFLQLKSAEGEADAGDGNDKSIFGKLKLILPGDNANPIKTCLSSVTTEGTWGPPTTLRIPIDNTQTSLYDTAKYVFTLYDATETYLAGGKSYYLGETVLKDADFNGKMEKVVLRGGDEDARWSVQMRRTYKDKEQRTSVASTQKEGTVVSMPIIESASELKKLFYLVDADGSGSISIQEMKHAMKKKRIKDSLSVLLGVDPSEVASKMSAILTDMDANSNGNVSWNEFKICVDQLERQQQHTRGDILGDGAVAKDRDGEGNNVSENQEQVNKDNEDDDEDQDDAVHWPSVSNGSSKSTMIPALPVSGRAATNAADKARIQFLMDVVRRLKAEGHYRKMQMQALIKKNSNATRLLQAMGKTTGSNKENQSTETRRYKEMKLRVQDLEEINKSLNVQLIRTKQQAKHRLKMEKDAALSIIRSSGLSSSGSGMTAFVEAGDEVLRAKLHSETRAKKALMSKVKKLQRMIVELQQGRDIDAAASALGSVGAGDLSADPLGFEEAPQAESPIRGDPGQIVSLELWRRREGRVQGTQVTDQHANKRPDCSSTS